MGDVLGGETASPAVFILCESISKLQISFKNLNGYILACLIIRKYNIPLSLIEALRAVR